MTKPFDRYELVANFEGIIRRTHGHSSARVIVGNLIIDFACNYARGGDIGLDLRATEFRIIEFLASGKNEALSKDTLLNDLYGGIDWTEPKIIDVFMHKLRRKIANAGSSNDVIDTVWRQG